MDVSKAEQYWPRLWQSCGPIRQYLQRRLPASLRSYVDEEDLLQETLEVAWIKIPEDGFVSSNAFEAWLMTVAKSRLVDAIRKATALKRGGGQAPVMNSQLSSYHGQFNPAGSMKTPSSLAVRGENRRKMLSAIGTLRPEYQQVIRLHYLESVTVSEIALQMKRTEQAVSMLLYRAVRALRQQLWELS